MLLTFSVIVAAVYLLDAVAMVPVGPTKGKCHKDYLALSNYMGIDMFSSLR